jgi:Fe-S cluster biogenesis protein NfuA
MRNDITIKEEINNVLKKEVEPLVAQDGGGVEFVDFKNGVVTVKLEGACSGCPMSEMTLKGMIEKILKEKISEVKEVKKA